MSIRNRNNPWTAEAPTFQDRVDTINYLERQNILIAESSVRTLQNGSFTNGPNIVVDEFTDADGTQGTVNTGSSTATYNSDTNQYALTSSIGTQTDLDSTEYSTSISSFQLIKTFSSIDETVFEGRNSLKVLSARRAECYYKFNYSDGTSLNSSTETETSTSYVAKTYTNPAPEKEVSSIDVYLLISITDNTAYSDENSYYSAVFTTGKTLIADTNTTTLDGNELGFAVSIPDSSIPTGTSITATISDGTSSLSATTIDSISKGIVIGNDGTLTSGTLEVTFTLATTSTSITPYISSFGVCILR